MISEMYTATFQLDPATESLQKALTLLEQVVQDHSFVPDYKSQLADLYWSFGIHHMAAGRRDEALTMYKKGLAIREQLVKDSDRTRLKVALATSYGEIGFYYAEIGEGEEALKWLAKNVAILEPIVSRGESYTDARRFLSNVSVARGTTLVVLGRVGEAGQEWRRAADLGKDQTGSQLRVNRAYAMAHLGEYAPVLAELDGLGADLPPGESLRVAGAAALCATAVSKDEALSDAERKRLAEVCAARAMEGLHRTRARLFQVPKQAAALLKADLVFEPLRSRDDFKKLVADLEMADGR
jgi:tetratricopeptide (TPR) repeat protein